MAITFTSKPKTKKATPVKHGAKPTPVSKYPIFEQTNGFRFRFPQGAIAPTIQPKLKIGEPNDKYEQEADQVADQVMRMPDSTDMDNSTLPGTSLSGIGRSTPATIQRLCSECEEEVQRQPLEDEEEVIQAKEISGGTPQVYSGLSNQINAIRDGGQPLPRSVRAFFEPRFGYDFNQVRIHSGTYADEATNLVRARAFTMGNKIVFGASEYSPHTNEGKHLLAHELTHVLQQRSIHPTTARIQRTPDEPVPDAPNLAAPLSNEELNRITRWLKNYSIGIEPLTGDRGDDFDMIARAILCNRLFDAGDFRSGDPLLCMDDQVTESDPRFAPIRQQIDQVFLPLPDATRPFSLDRQTDFVLFAMNLFIEGGPDINRVGRRAIDAVAQVVLNRVTCGTPPYGATARDVILQPAQFSWTNPRNQFFENAFFPLRWRGGLRKWLLCLVVAQQALSGGLTNPGIGQATHYYNPFTRIPPFAAAFPLVVQIGRHRFHQGPCP